MADTDPATGRELSPVRQRVEELLSVLTDAALLLWRSEPVAVAQERTRALRMIAAPAIHTAIVLKRWSVNQLAKIGRRDQAEIDFREMVRTAVSGHERRLKALESKALASAAEAVLEAWDNLQDTGADETDRLVMFGEMAGLRAALAEMEDER